jgi:hypothetical protein
MEKKKEVFFAWCLPPKDDNILEILTNRLQFRKKQGEEMDNNLEKSSNMALVEMSFNHHCSVSRPQWRPGKPLNHVTWASPCEMEKCLQPEDSPTLWEQAHRQTLA